MLSQQEFNDLLDKVLDKKSVYQSAHGQDLLQKLLANPSHPLSDEEKPQFSSLQALLQNPETTAKAQVIINMAILASQQEFGNWCAEHIQEAFKKRGDKPTDDSMDFTEWDMPRLSHVGWRALVQIFKYSRFTTVKLTQMGLDRLDDIQFNCFCELITVSQHITDLSLAGNDLDTLANDKLERIYGCLTRLRRLAVLDLYGNLLGRASENSNNLLFTTIAVLKLLRKLDFGSNCLDEFQDQNITKLFAATHSAGLSALDLKQNELGKKPKIVEELSDGIEKSTQLRSLTIYQNLLNELPDEQFKRLFQAFAKSKLTSLKIGEEDPFFSPSQWQVITDELRYNFTLQRFIFEFEAIDEMEVSPEVKQIIEELLARNQDIQATLTQAQKVLTEIEKNQKAIAQDEEKIGILIETIRATLEKLKKAKSILSESNIYESTQNYINEIEGLQNKLTLALARWLSNNSEKQPAVETWLDIPSTSSDYQQARIDAFQATYIKAHGTTQPGKTETISPRAAFIMALPCCLDDEQLLNEDSERPQARLNAEQQRLFDNFLWAAAGGASRGIAWKCDADERVALLRYVILMEILTNQKTNNAEEKDFFASLNISETFLNDAATQQLLAIRSDDCAKPQTQALLQALWANFVAHVEQLSVQEDVFIDHVNADAEDIEKLEQDKQLIRAISNLARCRQRSTKQTTAAMHAAPIPAAAMPAAAKSFSKFLAQERKRPRQEDDDDSITPVDESEIHLEDSALYHELSPRPRGF